MSERSLYRQPPNALRERYKFKSGYGCSASKYGLQSMARAPEFSVPMAVATLRCLPVDSVETDDRGVHTLCRSRFKLVPTAYASKGFSSRLQWIAKANKISHLLI